MTSSSKPARRRGREWLPWLRRLAVAGAIALTAPVGCHTVTPWLIRKSDRCVARDPATGICQGAERLDLGPAHGPRGALLLHGFLGGSNNFGGLPAAMAAEDWHVVAPRLPGHGTTPLDLRGVEAEAFITSMEAEWAALEEAHEQAVIVGHSMGASIGAILAARHDGVDALVLSAPYFGVSRRWYYVLPPETWTRALTPIVPWIYKGNRFVQVSRPEVKDEIFSYRWVHRDALRALLGIAETARRPETLDNITCPVLWMHSKQDVAASPEAAEEAFEAIGSEDKERHWLPRSNHLIYWGYDREEVVERTIAFCNRAVGRE